MSKPQVKILQKMAENLELIEIPMSEIKANPKNPKKHWIEGIKRSIEGVGMVELPVVDENNMLLAGHGRIESATELGYKSLPAIRKSGLTQAQKDQYLVDSNQMTIRGGFDFNLLRPFGEALLQRAGFFDKEIDQIFKADTKDDEFDAEKEVAKITKPKTKTGDVYQLGDHVLVCGDATKSADYAKALGSDEADMVFTDPPYNVDYKGGMNSSGRNTRQGIMNDKMTADKFHEFLYLSIASMMEYCQGSFYICMSSSEIPSLKKAFEDAGGHWQSFIIWVKNTFTLSRSDWQNQYEPILYGWNGRNKKHYFAGYRDEGNVWENLEKLKPSYDGEKTTIKLGAYHLEIMGKVEGRVIKKQDSVDIWYEKKPAKSPEHPTMKPIPLVAKAIKASSPRGGIVLDPFSGSGSTIVACEQTGRKCRAIELDPKYCDVIVKRWEQLTNRKAKKL